MQTQLLTPWQMANHFSVLCMNVSIDGNNFDAVAIYEEWVVDGKDPQDGGY